MTIEPQTNAFRFDAADLATFRRDLLARGAMLAGMLADVLAGKEDRSALYSLLSARPGMRPEEVVRNALAQVEGRRRLLDARDDRFGRCDVCGADLGTPSLHQMPWADRCSAHSAV